MDNRAGDRFHRCVRVDCLRRAGLVLLPAALLAAAAWALRRELHGFHFRDLEAGLAAVPRGDALARRGGHRARLPAPLRLRPARPALRGPLPAGGSRALHLVHRLRLREQRRAVAALLRLGARPALLAVGALRRRHREDRRLHRGAALGRAPAARGDRAPRGRAGPAAAPRRAHRSGVLALASTAAYLVLAARGRELTVRGIAFRLPSLPLAAAQVVVSAADWALAGARPLPAAPRGGGVSASRRSSASSSPPRWAGSSRSSPAASACSRLDRARRAHRPR